jgi:hypothetical protein
MAAKKKKIAEFYLLKKYVYNVIHTFHATHDICRLKNDGLSGQNCVREDQ